MATLAHPAAGEFGKRGGPAGAMRAALERAVDAAPSHIRPPRGRLQRLFARRRSARALIERYRLWPAIEHAYERITREYGPLRVEVAADSDWGDDIVVVRFYGDVGESDDALEFESLVRREIGRLLPGDCDRHLYVFLRSDPHIIAADK